MRAGLPPLLEFLDGTHVETLGDWERRRSQIRRLMCQYLLEISRTLYQQLLVYKHWRKYQKRMVQSENGFN